MKTLMVRYTKHDSTTLPGGVILRMDRKSDHSIEYVIHRFSRLHGSLIPDAYFWGQYIHDDLNRAINAFNQRVQEQKQYTLGGALIDDNQLVATLKKEIEYANERKKSHAPLW